MDVQKTPEWSAIKEYMTNLSFRPKRIGGLDPDSVVEGINDLTSLYNNWIEKLFAKTQETELRVRELEEGYHRKLDEIEQEYEEKKGLLEKDHLSRGEQLLANLEKTDIFCEQLKSQAKADAESVLEDIEKQADDVISQAKRRADDIVQKAQQKADKLESETKDKADKLMEKTLQDAFEISSQAQMMVDRSTEERELNEKRISKMRSETALFVAKMQKALDGVARIGLPEGDEVESELHVG